MTKSHQKLAIARNLLGVLALGSTIAYLQSLRLDQIISPAAESIEAIAETQQLKDQSQLSLLNTVPAFGFDNLVADWTFLSFLQYFGNSEHRQATSYSLSPDYFEVILNRDPYYFPFYQYLSSSVSIFAGQPEEAVALQESGLESLSPGFPPKSYFIWRQKGIDELLFLNDLEEAAHSHFMAADWAAQSTYHDAAEDQVSLRRTAEFLALNPDDLQLQNRVQINSWAQILMTAPDEKTRAVAVENIEALGGAVVQDENGAYSIQFDAE